MVDSGANRTSAETMITPNGVTPITFDVLWERHAGRALQLAGLLSGDTASAEDAVAEAFSRVWPRWRDDQVESFWPYLRVAIINQVRGSARRSRSARAWRHRQVQPQAAPSVEHEIAERAALAAALSELAPVQRRVLVLRYFEDLSEAETAKILGCDVGTVKSSASRGLVRLRGVLADGGDAND